MHCPGSQNQGFQNGYFGSKLGSWKGLFFYLKWEIIELEKAEYLKKGLK